MTVDPFAERLARVRERFVSALESKIEDTFAALPDLAGEAAGFEAVDETYRELTDAGHRARQPPYDAFWGARYAIVEDPDGNTVEFLQRDRGITAEILGSAA